MFEIATPTDAKTSLSCLVLLFDSAIKVNEDVISLSFSSELSSSELFSSFKWWTIDGRIVPMTISDWKRRSYETS